MAAKYTPEFKCEAIRRSTLGYLSPAEHEREPDPRFLLCGFGT